MKKRNTLTSKEVQCLAEFGKRIRALRVSKSWTLEQTEEHGWPAWQHLQQIESGKKNINFTTFIRLLQLFEADASEITKNLKA